VPHPTATSGRSVVFLAPEPLRPSITGPARRTVKLAEVVAEHCRVTLAAPSPSTFPDGPFRTIDTGPLDDQDLAAALAGHDVAVVQTLPSPRQLLTAMRSGARLVVDLIAPLALEALEVDADAGRAAVVRWRAREMVSHLAAADLVLCSNERQRDLLFGAGLAAGIFDEAGPLDARIAVVPHGLDARAPTSGRSALRTGELAGADLRIAIWGGGMWSWLDPLTAVRAVELVRPRRPDLRLAFVGFEHPDPAQRRSFEPVAAAARGYARDRGLEGDAVVFRPRWLERDDYTANLADADVGVSLHGETLEGRYASRTRILDYLETGLPVVAAHGDTMSDVVARHGLGRVVEPGDAAACADALDALTSERHDEGDRAAAIEPLLWRNVARPLVAFCADPPEREPRSAAAALALAARQYPAFARAVMRSGAGGGVARSAARRGASLLRGVRRDAR
jgi:glycosyltransferase involved in cell wall biosynthesis